MSSTANKGFDVDKAIREYKRGDTLTDIAKAQNVTYQTVVYHLKKAGVYQPTLKCKKGKEVKIDSTAEDYIPTRQEKIAYCNSVYGEGNWRFMSRDEIRQCLEFDFEFRR